MKFTAALSLGLFASSSLAVSVTQIMKGGGTNDLQIQTDGTCIDLFQGYVFKLIDGVGVTNELSTYGARLNGGVTGTKCHFWVYVLQSITRPVCVC